MANRDYQDYMIEKGVGLITDQGYSMMQLVHMPYFAKHWAVLQSVLDAVGAQDVDYEGDNDKHHRFKLLEMFKGEAALKDAAWMLEHGYRVETLRYLGYFVVDLAGHTTKKSLREGGFSKKAIDVGVAMHKSEAVHEGLDMASYVSKGYSARDLRSAGFGLAELRDAEIGVDVLKEAPFTMYELKASGFEAKELEDMGFGDPELLAAGFSEKAVRQGHEQAASCWSGLLSKIPGLKRLLGRQ
jgi:hypothetical protein